MQSWFLKSPAQRPLFAVLVSALFVLALCCLLSLLFGAGGLTPQASLQTLFGNGSPDDEFTVFHLRSTRTLIGLFVGLTLGIAGALMQAVARNPLAEPGLLGVSAGSSFAVAMALVMGASTATLTVGIAQLGALIGCICVLGAARMQGQHNDPIRLVLAGAALSSLLLAMTSLILLFDQRAADEIRFWVTGSVAGRDTHTLMSVLPSMLVAAACVLYTAKPLASLALGERVAIGLGHKPRRIRGIIIIAVALLVGGATAIAGPVAFIGLVVPFAARALVGPDIRRTLWLCLPLGPIIVISADIISRLVAQPTEMPLGVLTAIVGAPVLLLIVRSRRLPTL
ncbi:iron complex transport system permease protein [Marinomonas alcarazii]|uniref:Iron complex transport system permease protein n=1 Tax=Marinomonas alcarazii TaxID=491949 RepID=A0A318V9R9_9GAMM|nr:iron ABC transporter permease [Marinomonas alcarazii]PYF84680.1 iron complex transport system permease protein [Marinomonas alcarazii]